MEWRIQTATHCGEAEPRAFKREEPSMTRKEVEAIFRRYGPMVFRRARSLLHDNEEARDVMQEVFIKAMQEPGLFESPEDAARWLYRVATNACLNLLRDTRRRAEIRAEKLLPEEQTVGDADERLLARKLLAEADADWSNAAVLVHVDGLSYEEAATVLGVSKRTISNFLLRFRTFALARAREEV